MEKNFVRELTSVGVKKKCGPVGLRAEDIFVSGQTKNFRVRG